MRPCCALPLLAAFALPIVTAGAMGAEEKVLNVFTWPDYVAPNTIADFEKEYGIKVNFDTYDSTEMAEARLLAGRTGYDVVVPCRALFRTPDPDRRLSAARQRSKLTNWGNLDPWVLKTLESARSRATATACRISGAPRASRTTSR